MNFYTNDKSSKFEIVKTVRKLLSKFSELDTTYDVDYLKSIRHTVDYVREFIDYYFDEVGLDVSNESKDYIVNRIYAVKGGPEVLDVMSELLSVKLGDGSKSINFNIQCEYDFPDLKLLQFDTVKVTNINTFLSKLEMALFVTLFYRELNITIKHLIQVITGDLIEYTQVFSQPYVEIDVTINNEDVLPWIRQ